MVGIHIYNIAHCGGIVKVEERLYVLPLLSVLAQKIILFFSPVPGFFRFSLLVNIDINVGAVALAILKKEKLDEDIK